MQAEKPELLRGPTSGDISVSLPITPESRAVPGGKRQRIYQRNLAKCREAVRAGSLNPTVRNIRELCGCGGKAAESIRSALVTEGICTIDSRGRLRAA